MFTRCRDEKFKLNVLSPSDHRNDSLLVDFTIV